MQKFELAELIARQHRFHSIESDLKLLVFFAPAEGSRAAPPMTTG